MPHTPDFIVIDDDMVNNLICSKMLRLAFPTSGIQTFSSPEDGLAYIEKVYSEPNEHRAVLFLDINMPSMSGWEVLDHFAGLPAALVSQFSIYMLSSSIAQHDKEQASGNKLVSGYIEKPLSVSKLGTLNLQDV